MPEVFRDASQIAEHTAINGAPAMESLGTDGLNQCGSARSSAGRRCIVPILFGCRYIYVVPALLAGAYPAI